MRVLSLLCALGLAACGPLPGPTTADSEVTPTRSAQARIEFKVTGGGVSRTSLVADYPLCELTGTDFKFLNVNDQSNPSLVLTVHDFAFSATDPLTNLTGTFQDGTSLFPGAVYTAGPTSHCRFVLGQGANAQGLTATFTCGALQDTTGRQAELSLGTLACCLTCP